MNTISKWLPAIALLLGPMVGSAQVASYNFTSINYPGSTTTWVYGINNSGEIAGSYFTSSGYVGFVRGNNNNFTSFNIPGSVDTDALGINDPGQIAGTVFSNCCDSMGFIREVDGSVGLFSVSGGI